MGKRHSGIAEGLFRYYSLHQLHYQSSHRLTLFLSLASLLQTLALMVPPSAQPGYYWNYSLFWPVYYLINAVGRPDRLIVLAMGRADLFIYCLIGLVVCRLTLAFLGIALYYRAKKATFREETVKKRSDLPWNLWFRANNVAIFLVSRLLAVPLVGAMAEAIACFPYCLAEPTRSLVLCFLLLTAVIVLLDRVYTVDLQWEVDNEGPITPLYELLTVASDLTATVLVPLYPLADHDFLFRSLSLVCGVLKLTAIHRALPYHNIRRNGLESLKGAILIWQIALLTLGRNLSQPTVAPDLVLVLGFPLLCALNIGVVRWRDREMRACGVDSEAKQAKYLQECIETAVSRPIVHDVLSNHPYLQQFPLKNLQLHPLLWTIYYFLHTKEAYFLKITIANVQARAHSFLSEVAKRVCLLRAHIQLEESSDELALQRFLTLQKLYSKLQDLDYHSTVLFRDFDECLARKGADFSYLVKLSRRLSDHLQRINVLYHSGIDTFPRKITLLQAYASFLEMTGKSREAAKTAALIAKLSQRRRKKELTAADRLLTDDPKCIIIVVPLSGRNAYKVRWSVNANLLGYSEEDLAGVDFSVLLPLRFRSAHLELMKSLMDRQSVPRIFQGVSQMIVVNKDRELMQGSWQLFAVTDRESGCFTAVATLKVEPADREFALIDLNGRLAEVTPGFAAFARSSDFLCSADFTSENVIWRGEWNESTMIVSRDNWTLADRLVLPCFSLFRLRGRALRKANISLVPQGDYWSSQVCSSRLDSNQTFLSRITKANIQETVKSYVSVGNGSAKASLATIHFHLSRARNRVQKYRKYLLILLLAVLVLGVAVMVAASELFAANVLLLTRSTALITSNRLRNLSITSAYRSKELFLLSSNFSLYGNETKAREDLLKVAQGQSDMRAIFYGNISLVSEDFRRVLTKPIYPFWRYENNQFTMYTISLLDMMDEIARRAGDLALDQLGNITKANADFMTLYRNGASEAHSAFNSATHVYSESYAAEKQQVTNVLTLVATLGPLCCLVLALAGAVVLLALLEHWRQSYWTLILLLPHSTLMESLEIVYTRLSTLHQEDSNRPFSRPSDKAKYHSEPSFCLLTIVLILVCSVLSLSGLCLFLYGVNALGAELQDKAEYLDLLKQRGSLLVICQFLMREAWLAGSFSYSTVLPEGQFFANMLDSWENNAALSLSIENCFEFGCSQGLNTLFPSETHIDLLYSGLNFSDTPLKAGIRPLLHEFSQFSSSLRSELRQGIPSSYSSGKKLEKYTSLLTTALAQSVAQFDSDTESSLLAVSGWMRELCIWVGVLGAVLVVGGLCPWVQKVLAI